MVLLNVMIQIVLQKLDLKLHQPQRKRHKTDRLPIAAYAAPKTLQVLAVRHKDTDRFLFHVYLLSDFQDII